MEDVLLVAYHRDAVERLNGAARLVWEKLGQLSGPELEAQGGRRYRAGDRVITLSAGPGRRVGHLAAGGGQVCRPGAGSLVAITLKAPSCTWAQRHRG